MSGTVAGLGLGRVQGDLGRAVRTTIRQMGHGFVGQGRRLGAVPRSERIGRMVAGNEAEHRDSSPRPIPGRCRPSFGRPPDILIGHFSHGLG